MRKSLALAVLITSIASGQALACGAYGADKQHRSGPPIMKMVRKLDLRDDQKAQLKALKEEMKAEYKANKNSAPRNKMMTLDPMDANYDSKVAQIAKERAAVKEQRIIQKAKMKKQVYSILTPEQRSELQAIKKKKWEERRAYYERRAAEPFSE